MIGMRDQGRASQTGGRRAWYRPSAPLLLAAAAVTLIGAATGLSGAGVRASFPDAITLPAPQPGNASVAGPAALPADAPGAAPRSAPTTTVGPGTSKAPATAEAGQVSGGAPGPASTSPATTQSPPPQTTQQKAASDSSADQADRSGASSGSSGASTVPADYPVVTTPEASTATKDQ